MAVKAFLYRKIFPQQLAIAAMRRISSACGMVLMYHEVLPDSELFPAWTVVRESDFRWQMSYLQEYFDVVTIDMALERVAGRQGTDRPFVVVTFDDGYRGNFHTVLPIMESMGLPFTVYVATKPVTEGGLFWHDRIINLLNTQEDVRVTLNDKRGRRVIVIPRKASEIRRWGKIQRLLTYLKKVSAWERKIAVNRILREYSGIRSSLSMLTSQELLKLSLSSSVTIGSHTHGHELLDQLETPEILETLRSAKEHIGHLLGTPPKHFAYPNGNLNARVKTLVQNTGYLTAVTTLPGVWSKDNNILEIPRFGIGRFETRSGFRAMLANCF